MEATTDIRPHEATLAYLVITRQGFDALSRSVSPVTPIWLGAGVLSEKEVSELRTSGRDITVFAYAISPGDQATIADALETIREHHPDMPIRVEG